MADSSITLRDLALQNPLLGPVILIDELIRGQKEAKAPKQPQQPKQGRPYQEGDYIPGSDGEIPPPPPPGSFGGEARPPSPEGTAPPGGTVDVAGIAAVLQEAFKKQYEQTERVTQIPYLKELQKLRIEEFLAAERASSESALARTREKTYRDTQLGVLQAWNDVTRAQINKEAELAKSLATTAYLAHTPNQGVLAALSANLQSAASAYPAPRSVIN